MEFINSTAISDHLICKVCDGHNKAKCYDGNGFCKECGSGGEANAKRTGCDCLSGYGFAYNDGGFHPAGEDCMKAYECKACSYGTFSDSKGNTCSVT